jgi:hypothetical protein
MFREGAFDDIETLPLPRGGGCPRGDRHDRGPRRPDHITDPAYDRASIDKPTLELLGPRQLAWLDRWGRDWQGVRAKTALSATAFAGAVNTIYGRWWHPLDEQPGTNPVPGSPLPWTGDYEDGLGNRISIAAYANPEDRTDESKRGDGYGLARFDFAKDSITFECWPRFPVVGADGAPQQYPGWPVTVPLERPAAAGRRAAATGTTPAVEKPNVIVVLVDDMGWRDLSCQGSPYFQTPAIDRLAASGMRFTHGYSACTVCSPTRAAMMTGQYPARLHLTDWIPGHVKPSAKLQPPDWQKFLPLETVTVAERLGAAGEYLTGVGPEPSQPLDGLSLAPVLEGGTLDRDALYWHYPHYHPGGAKPFSAIRAGDWRLVRFYEDGRRELYNLRDDVGETTDRAAREPDRVASLTDKLDAWLASVGAQFPEQNANNAPPTPARP